jgi:hypothetical protein
MITTGQKRAQINYIDISFTSRLREYQRQILLTRYQHSARA